MYYWDGSAWVPTGASPPPPAMHRRPTSWTRPLQAAVIAAFGAQALYAASLPFWFINVMTQYANSMNARFGSPPPDAAAEMAQASQSANTIATIEFGVFVIVAVLGSLVVVVAATRLREWAFYVALVVLGLEFLWLGAGVLFALVPSVLVPGAPPPAAVILPDIGFGALAAGVGVWMIVALVKRGPWAMTRVS